MKKGDTMGRGRSILFLSSNFPPVIGGSSVVYDQICRNASEQVVVLAPRRNHETGQVHPGTDSHDRACGYPVHRVDYLRPPIPQGPRSRLGHLTDALRYDLPVMARALAAAIGLIVRYRVKVVCIGELVQNGWMVLPLRYLLGRRVVLYTHGEEISEDGLGLLMAKRAIWLRHAHKVVAVSLFCKSMIVARFHIDPAKVSVITNGVNLGIFNREGPLDPRALPAAAVGRKVVLAVSRLVERKGIDRLIRAFPAIAASIPEAHLVIAGSGPLGLSLEELARALGLGEDQVSFLGPISQERLVALYRLADVFALPCRTLANGDTEGFGLVFLEANACGTPVVAGGAGGTVEAVVDGETGLIVDGGDPQAIALAVNTLLADAPGAARMAEAGWKRALSYGWPAVARRFVEVSLNARKDAPEPAYQPGDITSLSLDGPTRLLVSVDLEEAFDWSTFSREGYQIKGWQALEEFHAGCRGLGVSPVYLATYPMLGDPVICAFLRRCLERGEAEVGIHLHGWVTPPYWEHPNVFNSYQCNLPEHVERRKLEALIALFTERMGQAPLLHRAGRWGGGARTAALLAEMGLRVDLSPCAGFGASPQGGPDFSALSGAPFRAGPGRDVLTIPATTLRFLRGPLALSQALFRWSGRRGPKGWASPLASLGTLVRFSSEDLTTAQLRAFAHELTLRKAPIATFTVHHTSLYGGGNDYAPDEAAARAVRERAFATLAYAIDTCGMRPTRCADLLAETRMVSPERSADLRSDDAALAPARPLAALP
ncbi:glycosyltransferase [Rhodospirillum rubrum]|uniref:Glycosyl transferase, group 1 n=1 Tax=Rhodospirillum rubrum (strain ATCC 11170 / ATH 1.1.1 / DSM 467 / LMG 4362 / NCIMB 8255 / S1) TaxID=269796 RepID=Q2RPQ9_RHORT|nr:glycosyltransferase [Rhodospirillum rubrum]ABC23886.1 Glycosyl transferase, group 1 [Rhodospirillum rubrum ATCC 11170]MBK5955562.1 glycosyl transferase family 1 [Rhodospirillum rubrum]QXG79832.1 glycosyltransferase [Rhodospirillum rubrum]HAP99169.1 glycosyl transferase family 1 [Rhodospirillum rubrum]HCF19113.1 glycosyl transferase family 1 [Rhodospirillum rubrum]